MKRLFFMEGLIRIPEWQSPPGLGDSRLLRLLLLEAMEGDLMFCRAVATASEVMLGVDVWMNTCCDTDVCTWS